MFISDHATSVRNEMFYSYGIADRMFESENSSLACAPSAAPASPRVQAAFPDVPGAQWSQIQQVSKRNLGALKDLNIIVTLTVVRGNSYYGEKVPNPLDVCCNHLI